MLRVPNFVKNYTIGCANSQKLYTAECANLQKLYCWVRCCYRQGVKGLHRKITETACVSMLALKINYNIGSAFKPFSATILSAAKFYLMCNVKKIF